MNKPLVKQFIPLLLAVLFIGAGCVFQNPTVPVAPDEQTVAPSAETFVGAIRSFDDAGVATVQLADGSTEQVRPNAMPILVKTDVGSLFTFEGVRDPSTRIIDLTDLTPMSDKNLVVVSPAPNATVTSPLVVSGFGRVFEQQFAWRIKDATGAVVDQGSAMTHAPDAGQFGPYSFEVFLPAMTDVRFALEMLEYSAKDGSETNLVNVPLTLLSTKSLTLKAYFPNAKQGSSADCSKVFAVDRQVAETSAVGRAAIAELLKGPTVAERGSGYSTAIPGAAALNSLVIGGRVATANFNEQLNPPGGSCAVTAIRAQIENTILQFDTVDSVTIQVNGDAATALQP
ncbi:hypothetical protein EBS80_00565 [bacterium]|nr:hypothetical protein [bacterium]